MVEARSIPASVLWHEGMLLSPQHFQQADLRQQVQLSYMMLAAAPYCWGVRQFTLDAAALVGGTFSVTALEAVMPDGLLVLHSADADPTAPKLELDLMPFVAAAAPKQVTVHLTVAARNTAAVRIDGQQRFRQIEDSDVPDENTGDNGISIPRLVPFLSLYVTDGPLRRPPSRFHSLPLAVLECGAQRVTRIDYEPPRFRIDHDSLLFQLSNRIRADLRGKATDWSLRLGGALAEGQAGLANESATTLRMIAQGLPRLEVLLATEATHPFELYLALCDIAGNLSAVGGRLMLPALGAYLHADPLTPFQGVAAYLDEALQQLRTPYRSIPFGHPDRDRFVLLMEPDHLREQSLVIGARMGPGQDVASVRAWFDTAVIGAASRVAALRINAVTGAARSVIGSAPELDMLPPPGMLLFRVTVQAGQIAAGDTLEISQLAVEGVTEPAELCLFLPAATESGAA